MTARWRDRLLAVLDRLSPTEVEHRRQMAAIAAASRRAAMAAHPAGGAR